MSCFAYLGFCEHPMKWYRWKITLNVGYYSELKGPFKIVLTFSTSTGPDITSSISMLMGPGH